MSPPMNIGKAAEAAGVSAKMIRHYEEIGLLPTAARTGSGYRQYGEREVSILRFIRQARRLGFPMQQIADLLGLWSNEGRASREVKSLAQAHLAALDEKMREIAEMKSALERLVAACQGDDDPHCAILEELAVASPSPPTPGSIEPKPPRKARQPKGDAPEKAPAPNSGHVDLMAWALGATQRASRR